jgi:hypothetical protein
LAGIGLALTSIRPQVTVLLAVPFLFRRQKVFAWFCAGAFLLGIVSLVSVGFTGLGGFLKLLLVSAGGDAYGLKEPLMVNLVGLLWRVVPGLGGNLIHWIGYVVYAATLIGLCILWARSRVITEVQIGLAVTLTLFAVPHLHYHDLTLLIVPLFASLLLVVRGKFLSEQHVAFVPLALSVAFLFSNFAPILKYNFPYLAMLLFVLIFWLPEFIFRSKRNSNVEQNNNNA